MGEEEGRKEGWGRTVNTFSSIKPSRLVLGLSARHLLRRGRLSKWIDVVAIVHLCKVVEDILLNKRKGKWNQLRDPTILRPPRVRAEEGRTLGAVNESSRRGRDSSDMAGPVLVKELGLVVRGRDRARGCWVRLGDSEQRSSPSGGRAAQEQNHNPNCDSHLKSSLIADVRNHHDAPPS
jgi:hypothetical protein